MFIILCSLINWKFMISYSKIYVFCKCWGNEKNKAINKDVQEEFTLIDDDKASEGLPYLRKNELHTDETAQMDEHWAIQRECTRKFSYSH